MSAVDSATSSGRSLLLPIGLGVTGSAVGIGGFILAMFKNDGSNFKKWGGWLLTFVGSVATITSLNMNGENSTQTSTYRRRYTPDAEGASQYSLESTQLVQDLRPKYEEAVQAKSLTLLDLKLKDGKPEPAVKDALNQWGDILRAGGEKKDEVRNALIRLIQDENISSTVKLHACSELVHAKDFQPLVDYVKSPISDNAHKEKERKIREQLIGVLPDASLTELAGNENVVALLKETIVNPENFDVGLNAATVLVRGTEEDRQFLLNELFKGNKWFEKGDKFASKQMIKGHILRTLIYHRQISADSVRYLERSNPYIRKKAPEYIAEFLLERIKDPFESIDRNSAVTLNNVLARVDNAQPFKDEVLSLMRNNGVHKEVRVKAAIAAQAFCSVEELIEAVKITEGIKKNLDLGNGNKINDDEMKVAFEELQNTLLQYLKPKRLNDCTNVLGALCKIEDPCEAVKKAIEGLLKGKGRRKLDNARLLMAAGGSKFVSDELKNKIGWTSS